VKLGEGELRGAIDGDEEREAPLLGVHLGDVDVEEADRVCLEAGAFGLGTVRLRQPRDAVTLEAACSEERVRWGSEGCRA
jgi:hypothetical protein